MIWFGLAQFYWTWDRWHNNVVILACACFRFIFRPSNVLCMFFFSSAMLSFFIAHRFSFLLFLLPFVRLFRNFSLQITRSMNFICMHISLTHSTELKIRSKIKKKIQLIFRTRDEHFRIILWLWLYSCRRASAEK